MAATAVQVSQHVDEWVRLFPKEVTENYSSSIMFVKQLTVVAISSITYLKNAFPSNCYNSEAFAGLKVKVLKERCQDEMAQFVSTALLQAFDAFDKKYVHQLALCFYRGDCSAANLLEYFVFEYAFTQDGVALTLNSRRESAERTFRVSMEEIRKSTATMVRSVSMFVSRHCMQELPPNYDVSLRLYYNDDAPEDYQAPGFSPSPEPDHLQEMANVVALVLGRVETPFHQVTARAVVRASSTGASDGGSDAAVPSDNLPEMTPDSIDDYEAYWCLRGGGGGGGGGAGAGGGAAELRCACGGADRRGLVTCQYCHTQQHAECFGLLAPAPEHCCELCADQDPERTPSCPLLVGINQRKRECLCNFRRTLVLCSRQSAVSGSQLQARLALSAADAAKQLRVLRAKGVLPAADTQDLTLPTKVDPIYLKLAMERVFRMEDQKESTVERLAAESERHDSVEAAVGPPRAADPVLLQYRAALGAAAAAAAPSAAADEELPLSGEHNPVSAARLARRPKRKADADDEDWTPSKKLRSSAKTNRKH